MNKRWSFNPAELCLKTSFYNNTIHPVWHGAPFPSPLLSGVEPKSAAGDRHIQPPLKLGDRHIQPQLKLGDRHIQPQLGISQFV